MNKKVLEVLKPLYASKGFNKDELESLAEIASKNLTDESTEEEIKNVCDGLLPYAELMQRVGNRYATNVEKKYEGYVKPEPKPVEEPKVNPKPLKSDALSLEDIQKMMEEVSKKAAEDAVAPYRQKEEKSRLRDLLDSNEKLKGIPKTFRELYQLDKEEDIDSVVSRIETDYATLKQDQIKSGEFATPPPTGNMNPGDDELIERLHAMGKRAENK